ncbi:MAG: hypothetical protein GX557_03280 [Chloroflexi bacterium]|nr:hypothetical protein [Chloroflexota bacterium]
MTLPEPLSWRFPAESTHDGIPLGNGLFGALLWGADQHLRMTINRADYWDHRGGIRFGPEATYANLRRWLCEGDFANLKRVFEGQGTARPGDPPRPTRLPMGRVDLALEPRVRLARGTLHLGAGEACIAAEGAAPGGLRAVMPRGRALLAVRVEGLAARSVSAASVPADGEDVRRYWQQYGVPTPQVHDGVSEGGWTQAWPSDPVLGVAWALVSEEGARVCYVAALYGATPEEALARARAELAWGRGQGYAALAAAEAAWWRAYWAQTARVTLPDRPLQELYELALFKLAGLSWPGTPAATLQGPWVEEYRMPPWCGDYHFNINAQECYWPAFSGNQLGRLEPLFALLKRWEPVLRENARLFLGIDDGLMLNHAVDDRATVIGGYWAGTVDHGSTAWVGQLMWQYYLHTLDRAFLAETAYPFMRGALRAYEAMLERAPDGSYHLPVSVSPEYGGAGWGRDASFQLAIVHFLCRALIKAAGILGLREPRLEIWREIDAHTPLGCIAGEGDKRELQIWEGQPLAESHRHHSHLAGLYPFDVLDPWHSSDDRTLLANSMTTWTRQGKGMWTGWCMPWAAILEARMHNGDHAGLLLDEYRRVFTTPGRASLHDGSFQGYTIFARRPDIMQIEAGMGAAAAVLEMLAHTAAGILYVFPALPRDWDDVAFEGLRTEGAFLVSAERRAGRTQWVRVRSTADSRLRLAWPFAGEDVVVRSSREGETRVYTAGSAETIERDTVAGEELTFSRS